MQTGSKVIWQSTRLLHSPVEHAVLNFRHKTSRNCPAVSQSRRQHVLHLRQPAKTSRSAVSCSLPGSAVSAAVAASTSYFIPLIALVSALAAACRMLTYL